MLRLKNNLLKIAHAFGYGIGFFIGILLSPFIILYIIYDLFLRRKKGEKMIEKKKCLSCEQDFDDVSYNGLCESCMSEFEKLLADIITSEDDPMESNSNYEDPESWPWISIEFVPVGHDDKEIFQRDISIDDNSLPYIMIGNKKKYIGRDGYAV